MQRTSENNNEVHKMKVTYKTSSRAVIKKNLEENKLWCTLRRWTKEKCFYNGLMGMGKCRSVSCVCMSADISRKAKKATIVLAI